MIFVASPGVSGIQGYLKSKEAVWEAAEVGTTRQGMPGPRGAQVGCAPLGAPSGTSLAQLVSSGPEKISKKFRCVWTPFGIDFLRSKKIATSTGHYVNRLVPKNDIKLL